MRHVAYSAFICAGWSATAKGEFRQWTDLQGRTIEAEYVSATEKSVTVLRASDRRSYEIALHTLSEDDRRYVANRLSPDTIEESMPSAATSEMIVDRTSLPNYNQSDYRGGSKSCGPASALNFIIWWGRQLYPDLLPKATKEQQVERVHRSLVTYCGSSSGGTEMLELQEGVREYFARKAADFEVELSVVYAPSPSWFAEHAQGYNGVIALHGYYKESGNSLRRDGGHYTSVVTIEGDEITLNTWGRQFNVKMQPVKEFYVDSPWVTRDGKVVYEYIEPAAPDLLPEDRHGVIESVLLMKIRKKTPDAVR